MPGKLAALKRAFEPQGEIPAWGGRGGGERAPSAGNGFGVAERGIGTPHVPVAAGLVVLLHRLAGT